MSDKETKPKELTRKGSCIYKLNYQAFLSTIQTLYIASDSVQHAIDLFREHVRKYLAGEDKCHPKNFEIWSIEKHIDCIMLVDVDNLFNMEPHTKQFNLNGNEINC